MVSTIVKKTLSLFSPDQRRTYRTDATTTVATEPRDPINRFRALQIIIVYRNYNLFCFFVAGNVNASWCSSVR